MPGVDIYINRPLHNMFDTDARDSLKTSVRRFGTTHFSVDEKITLNEHDFSFKFHTPEIGDELTHDLIVRVRLHAFEERLAHLDDTISAEMAHYIAEDLARFFLSWEVTIGVELMLAEIMWGTATTAD